MVELRKRKAPTQLPSAEKKTKKSREPAKASAQSSNKQKPATPATTPTCPVVGDTIALDGFGGEIELDDGTKTTLKQLVEESKSGVVLFTYPRASTPGCTKQACMFRDKHDQLISTGLAIYGLSADSTKANTSFKTKQNLPYPLLCDTASTLISAIGFKKVPKGTTRGVFAVDKEGEVLLLQPGGPDATVDAVERLVSMRSQRDQGETGDETGVSPGKSTN
ncbi:thioredoxin peroxidase DOT5 [Aspergillus clavatus NRRL 1]|uniref:thioredoxin-dependent peroxiredoxin n=1 Tax=Aspergillus clavatus (strain ATCC 1007 / CBS 513.65 / DSM 816 / NCTC 3887 / NRRL 1 / QM 1276 / 107) TaxID=344612 RepID=A1CGP9_ASPCL|nr:disrupter of telomere silencing protein Dot5, putative [Aspergillus clavatus NRRL 1]EAW10054.1 disrupter of telomere silencing protein Dot5, putative [Aspergillus clavatus NRRL 1]